jgi:hypothetical protein
MLNVTTAGLYRGVQAYWADLLTLCFFFLLALALTHATL